MIKQSLIQVLVQQMKVESQYLKSCFPISEKYIFEHQAELLHCREWTTKYAGKFFKSVMDMIFCNMYPYYAPYCMKYYKGKCKQLGLYLSIHQLKLLDQDMHASLQELIKALKN